MVCSMNEQIPVSYIRSKIDVMENELEYELYEDDDRKKCLVLSSKISALKELIREWNKGK